MKSGKGLRFLEVRNQTLFVCDLYVIVYEAIKGAGA